MAEPVFGSCPKDRVRLRSSGTCEIQVIGGLVPCTGDMWRRVTFIDPHLSITIPITWQVGVGGSGLFGNAIRLSSAVEDLPLQVEDIPVVFSAASPLLSAGPADIVLSIIPLSDTVVLLPRPEDFAYPGLGITRYVPGRRARSIVD